MSKIALGVAISFTLALCQGPQRNAIAQTSAAAAEGPPCGNLVGIWKNQLNSTFVVYRIDSGSGLLSGCYCSPSGGGNQWFDATGWVQEQHTDNQHTQQSGSSESNKEKP